MAIKESLEPKINIQNSNFDNVLKLNCIKQIDNKEETSVQINNNRKTINSTKKIMKITNQELDL